tara:strand:- start:2238 stop:2528 length:291 start_codon:yes stop_codon:yes gene_type:complete
MTIEHIVLLEKKDDATDEQTQAALAGIRRLKEKIPGVLEVKISDNITDRAPYSHGAIITMLDRETLAGYGPHPAHQQVLQLLQPVAADLVVVDIEI